MHVIGLLNSVIKLFCQYIIFSGTQLVSKVKFYSILNLIFWWIRSNIWACRMLSDRLPKNHERLTHLSHQLLANNSVMGK